MGSKTERERERERFGLSSDSYPSLLVFSYVFTPNRLAFALPLPYCQEESVISNTIWPLKMQSQQSKEAATATLTYWGWFPQCFHKA